MVKRCHFRSECCINDLLILIEGKMAYSLEQNRTVTCGNRGTGRDFPKTKRRADIEIFPDPFLAVFQNGYSPEMIIRKPLIESQLRSEENTSEIQSRGHI